MSDTDTARNASLNDLVEILRNQEAKKHDIVLSASKIRARNAQIVVKGAEQELSLDGVTSVDGTYRPTRHFDTQLGKALGIAPSYLSRCRVDAPDLYDANANGWLAGRAKRNANGETEVLREPDARTFLLRTFSDGNGGGVARALLSDRYAITDNLDSLFTCLEAIKSMGVETEVRGADLSDTHMYVDLHAPAVAALAPTLLRGYRNPFSDPAIEAQRSHGRNDIDRWREVAQREGKGYEVGAEPIVFSGFRISNSELGGGAWSITPKLLIKICRNGLVIPGLAIRNVHLGGRQEEGVVRWSEETRQAELAVIRAKTKDAVRTFLSQEFLDEQINKVEEKAGKKIDKPVEVIKSLGKTLNFSQSEQDGILSHFTMGGQMTAGGVVQALTSYSQCVADANRADEIDSLALRALDLVA